LFDNPHFLPHLFRRDCFEYVFELGDVENPVSVVAFLRVLPVIPHPQLLIRFDV
jgi:hypothetical protein